MHDMTGVSSSSEEENGGLDIRLTEAHGKHGQLHPVTNVTNFWVLLFFPLNWHSFSVTLASRERLKNSHFISCSNIAWMKWFFCRNTSCSRLGLVAQTMLKRIPQYMSCKPLGFCNRMPFQIQPPIISDSLELYALSVSPSITTRA